MITEETIVRVKSSLQATKSFTALEVIEELKKENEELKADKEWLDNTNNEQTEVILQLNEQIEKLSNDNRVLRTALFTQKIQIEKMMGDVKVIELEKENEQLKQQNKIKEMLKDIIDNGAEYEFRWLRTDGWSDWKSYRLGEEILCNDSRYEYRKIAKIGS